MTMKGCGCSVFILIALLISTGCHCKAETTIPKDGAESAAILTLIEQLASPNPIPDITTQVPDAVYPPKYSYAAQRMVSEAVVTLTGKSLISIPYLIESLDDQRYSYTYAVQQHHNATVGDACFRIIKELLQPYAPWTYMTRKGTDGKTYFPIDYFWDRFRKTNRYDKDAFRSWWRKHEHLSQSEIQLEVLQQTIAEEKQRGFTTPEDERKVLTPLLRKAAEITPHSDMRK